jgi:hypothetical protein
VVVKLRDLSFLLEQQYAEFTISLHKLFLKHFIIIIILNGRAYKGWNSPPSESGFR